MKKTLAITFLLILFNFAAATTHAMGLEIAVGGWYHSPGGSLAYDPDVSSDKLDLENDLGYEEEFRPTGRIKLDLPLFLPNFYFVGAPMEFEGKGNKNTGFTFGDETFDANVDFDSKIQLDQYDIAIYYGIPMIKTATLGMLNIDLGLNLRIINFETEIDQKDSGFSESESLSFPLPMVYLAAQLNPLDLLDIEAEFRGIAYNDNHLYSFICRVKYQVFGPVFAAVGYRYDTINIDEQDVEVDVDFSGPIFEAGVIF